MNLLAVDTASASCSVAIVGEAGIVSELTIVTRQTHSKHLLGMIETVMRHSGLSRHEIDGYAVTRGPGSFTGLRIGISTLRGIAEATGKPIAGVSSLDALAMGGAVSNLPVCSMLDARRGEVYFAWYRFEAGVMRKTSPEAVAPPETVVSGIKEPSLFVGDGAAAYRDVISAGSREYARLCRPCDAVIRASNVAGLAMPVIREPGRLDPQLTPRYIRKCDAEVNRMQRLASG